jgi:hypothetical protein
VFGFGFLKIALCDFKVRFRHVGEMIFENPGS